MVAGTARVQLVLLERLSPTVLYVGRNTSGALAASPPLAVAVRIVRARRPARPSGTQLSSSASSTVSRRRREHEPCRYVSSAHSPPTTAPPRPQRERLCAPLPQTVLLPA